MSKHKLFVVTVMLLIASAIVGGFGYYQLDKFVEEEYLGDYFHFYRMINITENDGFDRTDWLVNVSVVLEKDRLKELNQTALYLWNNTRIHINYSDAEACDGFELHHVVHNYTRTEGYHNIDIASEKIRFNNSYSAAGTKGEGLNIIIPNINNDSSYKINFTLFIDVDKVSDSTNVLIGLANDTSSRVAADELMGMQGIYLTRDATTIKTYFVDIGMDLDDTRHLDNHMINLNTNPTYYHTIVINRSDSYSPVQISTYMNGTLHYSDTWIPTYSQNDNYTMFKIMEYGSGIGKKYFTSEITDLDMNGYYIRDLYPCNYSMYFKIPGVTKNDTNTTLYYYYNCSGQCPDIDNSQAPQNDMIVYDDSGDDISSWTNAVPAKIIQYTSGGNPGGYYGTLYSSEGYVLGGTGYGLEKVIGNPLSNTLTEVKGDMALNMSDISPTAKIFMGSYYEHQFPGTLYNHSNITQQNASWTEFTYYTNRSLERPPYTITMSIYNVADPHTYDTSGWDNIVVKEIFDGDTYMGDEQLGKKGYFVNGSINITKTLPVLNADDHFFLNFINFSFWVGSNHTNTFDVSVDVGNDELFDYNFTIAPGQNHQVSLNYSLFNTCTNDGRQQCRIDFNSSNEAYLNISGLNMTYLVFGNLTYSPNLTETAHNKFTLSFYNASTNSTVDLILEGSRYRMSDSWTSPHLISTYTMTNYTTWTNYSFYFDYNISLMNGSQYSGTTEVLNLSQYVMGLEISSCGAGDDNTTLNLTFWDEDKPTDRLTTRLRLEMLYWIGDPAHGKNYTALLTGDDEYLICLTEYNETIRTNLYALYNSTTGFTHRYYIYNGSLTNESSQHYLYNFGDTTDVADLKVTARNKESYDYFANVVGLLQRRYVDENLWRTVQMDKSGDFGLLFYNIREEGTDYRFIYKDLSNNVLYTTNTMKFVCTSGVCEITQLIDPYSGLGASPLLGIVHSFNNDTKVLTVEWNDPLGLTSSVRAVVSKPMSVGNRTICDETKTGAAGIINCNLTGYKGDVLLSIYSSASPEEITESVWYKITSKLLGEVAGLTVQESALWSVGILVTTVMFGLFSPAAAIIAMMFGLIIILVLGLFTPMTMTFVMIAGIIGIVIGLRVKR